MFLFSASLNFTPYKSKFNIVICLGHICMYDIMLL
nr:hypothetical protein YSBCXYJI_YSBCXYJI_CDS_0056 [Caudoviricetes sp.]